MKKYFYLIMLIVLTSCSSLSKIQETYRANEFNLNNIKNSSISFCGTEKIATNDLKSFFNEEYSEKDKFNEKLFNDFQKEFQKNLPTIQLINFPLKSHKTFKNEIDNFFSAIKTDYFIWVKSVEIRSKNEFTAIINKNTFGGTANFYYLATIEIELWSVAEQKQLLSFKGIGEDGISILSKRITTINQAIENSIEHSVEYIKNNAVIK